MCDIKYKNLIEIYNRDGVGECLHFLKSSSTSDLKELALKRSVERIITEYKNINKSVSRPNFQQKINTFMETNYALPRLCHSQKETLCH